MPRTTRKPWSVAEKGQLKGYFEQAASTPAWNELAERLGTGRTGKQVQAMAAKLKLTEPVGRHSLSADGGTLEIHRFSVQSS